MAEFTHLSAATTSPIAGSWLGLFSAPANWSQVELTATSWTIRGTAQTQYVGWTVSVTSVNGFASDASGIPTGLVASMDVRNASGDLVVTVRDLAGLTLQARDMTADPSRLFAGNDIFTGSSGDDSFWGGTGVDSISGGAGNDTFHAQSGVVDGGTGYDVLRGSGLAPSASEAGVSVRNVESIEGGVINVAPTTTGVTINGTSSADLVTGGVGSDIIETGWGWDTIRPGLGDDYVDAGNPTNSFGGAYMASGRIYYLYTHTHDTSKDTLDFGTSSRGVTVDLAVTTAQDTGVGSKTLLGFEILRGSAFNDVLSGVSFVLTGSSNSPTVSSSPTGSISIYGGAGDDRIIGGIAGDLLAGEDGNDTLAGQGGANVLQGGAGFDVVDYTGRASSISITIGAEAQTTGDTFNSIEGVIGSAFADTLSSSTAAGGAAFLAGGAGNDLILGAQFNDLLQGGAGADTLNGGAGADKYVLALDGSVDQLVNFSGAEGDFILLLDSAGAIADGSRGLLIFNQTTRQLSWDADSDAGPSAPVVIAEFNGGLDINLSARTLHAAGFQPSGVRDVYGLGKVETIFDWGAAAFDYVRTGFAANGSVEIYDVFYDSGAKTNRWWDVGNTGTWSSRAADYDAQGRMMAYGVDFDDGSRQVFQFDTLGTKSWERLVESYDALGRLTYLGVKSDDGTGAERFVDTYDTQPWAYYIDNYDAAGRLLNHTFYNADGTVFTG